MDVIPYIVVGSGCTAAMAAQTLVEAGEKVLMLEVGIRADVHARAPNRDFLSIRKNDEEQYRYFLGENFDGISWGKVGKGEQLTPARRHIFAGTDTFLPVASKTFSPAESLGYGGLGLGWGIGCWEFSKPELTAAQLPYEQMQTAYNEICRRIGISATKDEAAEYTLGSLQGYQQSPSMDANHKLILTKYARQKTALKRKGFVMGRAPLALLTKDLNGRKKYAYRDMDFYSDNDKSAYRPWMTVDNLRKRKNFTYQGNVLVISFTERKKFIELHCLDTTSQKSTLFRCKRLVLGTGTLGSARIAMRSFHKDGLRTPILCNPYSYVPCLQPRMVGREAEPKKLGFSQLSLFLDETQTGFDVAMASLYSYQSLMLFRIVRQVPLNFADARLIMQYLSSALVIMGIHQPDRPSSEKYLELVADAKSPTGDVLKAVYTPTSQEVADRKRREHKYMKAARQLGIFPIKRLDPGFGSSIHYAGTLPYSNNEDAMCTLSSTGRLHGTRNVYVADSSGFNYLPAKGLTFSLMANAHIVAGNALKHE